MSKNMFLTTSTWHNRQAESFKLIPATNDCPFLDAFYDPYNQVLIVTSEKTQDQFTTLEKLNQYGEAAKKDGRNLVDRVRVSNNKQYFIDKTDEIREFVNRFALNSHTFDIEKFLTGTIVVPEALAEALAGQTEEATADLS